MAKQVKALKCPHCGSVKKQQVKDDHYLCSNCGTEYYLDNDDINVNIRHTYNQPVQPKASPRAIITVAGIFFALIVVLPALVNLFKKSGKSGTVSSAGNEKYRERPVTFYGYGQPGTDKPLVVFLVSREPYGSGNRKEESLIRFYDPEKEKILKDIPIPEWKETPAYMRFRRFDNGRLYTIANEVNKIYELDEARMEFKDVTDALTAELPELSSGLATVSFVSEKEGNGFRIMTNDGKEFYFYPIVKKLYKNYAEQDKAFDAILPGAIDSIYYTFSEKSNYYEEEKIQLLKIWYKFNPGYPLHLEQEPAWYKDYDFRENDPRQKRLFKEEARIVQYKDLSPGRLYFDAEIAAWNHSDLYITGKPNANPKGLNVLQKIDINSGQVLWTYTPAEQQYQFYEKEFYTYANGIIFSYYNWGAPARVHKVIILDKSGKPVKELDMEKMFK